MVMPTNFMNVNRAPIIALCQPRVPAVYRSGHGAGCAGLLRADTLDLYRRAAGYVDLSCAARNPRIAGAAADKFEALLNLKTAKALDLVVPIRWWRSPTR